MIDVRPDIRKNALFKDLSNEDFEFMMTFLEGHIKSFEKEDIIIDYFRLVEYAGIVLQGQVKGVMLNENGNEYSLNLYYPGDIFATSYSLLKDESSLVQFRSIQQSQILFVKLSNLLKEDATPIINQFKSSLLKVVAANNTNQNKRMQVLAQKSIRDKISIYLYSMKESSSKIILPLNRQALADYLNVDRCALSRELSNLKKEGYIDYHKNEIDILNEDLLDI